MYNSNSTRLFLAVAAMLLATGQLAAQQPEEQPAAPEAQDSGFPDGEQIQAWLAEYQQVHVQLEGIQTRALEDPQLNSEQEQLGVQIRAAMQEQDPTMPDRMARAQAIESEVVAAQAAADTMKISQLMNEAQAMEEHFYEVQQQVLATPAVAESLTGFQTRLEQKMAEVDPTAPTLIARFKELEMMIQEAIGGGA